MNKNPLMPTEPTRSGDPSPNSSNSDEDAAAPAPATNERSGPPSRREEHRIFTLLNRILEVLLLILSAIFLAWHSAYLLLDATKSAN